MYLTPAMLAYKNGCCKETIARIVKEMKKTGLYPTAVRRCGHMTIDEEQFDHYVARRPYGKEKGRKEEEEPARCGYALGADPYAWIGNGD